MVVGTGERRRRYIVCRNQQEAERQRHHREEILTALKAKLARLDPDAAEHSKRACELVAAARYGRPLTRGPGGRLALNAEAVRAAARLDGKKGYRVPICRTRWTTRITSSTLKGLVKTGAPVRPRNSAVPGASVSPVRKITRRTRSGWRRSSSR